MVITILVHHVSPPIICTSTNAYKHAHLIISKISQHKNVKNAISVVKFVRALDTTNVLRVKMVILILLQDVAILLAL